MRIRFKVIRPENSPNKQVACRLVAHLYPAEIINSTVYYELEQDLFKEFEVNAINELRI